MSINKKLVERLFETYGTDYVLDKIGYAQRELIDVNQYLSSLEKITLKPSCSETCETHQMLEQEIYDRLDDSPIKYDFIVMGIEYYLKNACLGECDVWARYTNSSGKVYDLFFECKSSEKGLKKAREQLNRASENLGQYVYQLPASDIQYKFIVTPNMIEKI